MESEPLEFSGTAGTYRLIAQTISGRELKIPAGMVSDFDEILFPVPELDDDLNDEPPGESEMELGDEDFNLEEVAELNSVYSFPGLPSLDDLGTSISYAVVLGDDDLLLMESEFETPVQEFFDGEDDFVSISRRN